MEGLDQEENGNEVIVIDDSSDGETHTNKILTCTSKSTEPDSVESAESETALGIIQKSLTPKVANSLASHAKATSSHIKTVHFHGHVIHVRAVSAVSAVEDCPDKGTSSECHHVEDVPDTPVSIVEIYSDKDTSSECHHIEDVPVSAVEIYSDKDTSSEYLPDTPVSAVEICSDKDTPVSAVEICSDKDTSLERYHIEDVPVSAVEICSDKDTSLECCHVEDVPDTPVSAVESYSDKDTSSECHHLEDAPVSAVEICSDKDTSSECHHIEDVSAVEICSDKDTSSECRHIEDVPDLRKVGHQQHDNTDLTVDKCPPSSVKSSNVTRTSDDACSTFSETDSNIGKEDTHSDARKKDKHILAPEKSAVQKPIKSSLDCKSVNISSDGMANSNSDNKSNVSDVQSRKLAIPTSSEKLIGQQSPSDVTGKQLKPTCTDPVKCNNEVLQGTQVPRYIIIHNSGGKQEVVRKPGDKLTSLLQRLTAGRGGKVAVTLSNLTRPLSVPATEAQAKVSQDSLSGSPSVSVGSMNRVPTVSVVSMNREPTVSVGSMNREPSVSQHTVKELLSRTSGKPAVSHPLLPQNLVSQEPVPSLKLPSQKDSSAKTDQSRASSKAKTTGFEKISIPVKIIPGKDPAQILSQVSVQLGSQAKTSQSINMSLVHTKPSEASIKSGGQVITVFGNVEDNKQPPDSSGTRSVAPRYPADKIKYVLNYLPLQGSRTSNIVFAGPEGQNITVGKVSESYLQSSGVKNTSGKSKYQFSLLQNTAVKFPEPVQMNRSMQDGIRKPPPTVRSLLTSSFKTAPTLNPTKSSTSETAGTNAPASLCSLPSTFILQDTIKPSTFPNTEHNIWTHKKQYQMANAGQICPPSASLPVAVTSGDTLSTSITTLTLSKLTATQAVSQVSVSKACVAPSAPPSTTSSRTIVVMPTAVLSTPVHTILTPSPTVSSKSCVPAGVATYHNIPATANQSAILKTNAVVPKTPEVNTGIQSPANTVHTFSDLISRIALQSLPSTSANRPTSVINPAMQSLNIALLQQLRQEMPQIGEAATPIRIIVSQGSSFKSAASSVCAQSEPAVFTHYGTITTPTGKKITFSKKTTQRSAAVTDANSKQIPKLIYPKPVSSSIICAQPNPKSVSLLPMPFIAKNHMTSESSGGCAVSNNLAEPHLIIKPKIGHAVGASGVKGKPTINTTQKNSYSRKGKLSVNEDVTTHRKPKNVVYAAIVRTGQGPVSVRVVAPDMDDDSSDTMSDTCLSNVMLSEESVPATEYAKGKATCVDGGLSNKLFENDMSHLVCSEEVTISDQDTHDKYVHDDAVSNTGMKDMGSSKESVDSYHHIQYVSDEETDTDSEITTMEEQDMSVLRQLLTTTDSMCPLDPENTQNIHQLSAPSGLVDLCTAGNQSGNELSADHESLTLLTVNTENNSVDEATEQFVDVESCDLEIESEFCDLKIESVFSLSDAGGFEDTQLPADGQICQELPDDKMKLLPMFNVRTSDDWKSFLSPCFVVLERLSKSEVFVARSAKIASKCSGYCRKRTLDYLCNLNLLRCMNHPDPFMFLKSKQKRVAVEKKLRKINNHDVIKEMCIDEEVSNCSQMVKDVFVKQALGELSQLVKVAGVKEDMSKFSPMVKETYAKEEVSESLSVVKDNCVKKAMSKTASKVKGTSVKKPESTHFIMTKEGYIQGAMSELHPLVKPAGVKETMNKSSPVVKPAGVKETMNKSSPVVKPAGVKETMNKSSPVVKPAGVKETMNKSSPVVKPASVKETMNKSSPVVKPAGVKETMNKLPQMVREACVQDTLIKSSPVIKETCVKEDSMKSLPQFSVLPTSLKEELSHKPLENDTEQLSVVPSDDSYCIDNSHPAQDDEKTIDRTPSDLDKTPSELDSICSGIDTSKFHGSLKQLQKQVNRKRTAMLIAKLSRNKDRESPTKHNVVQKCKIKLAGRKHTNKVVVKEPTMKLLSKKLIFSADTRNTLAKSTDVCKHTTSGTIASKLHINSLPVTEHSISNDSSCENILSEKKEASSADTPGMKPVSDSRITQLSDVQSQSIRTKGQFVRLQPKVPVIPAGKIQAALQSLNSYLAVTGGKPTAGNTQYILLKIDDQHVLVKWPASSVPTSQQSSMTVPCVSIPSLTASADNSEGSSNRDTNKQKHNEAVSITAAAMLNNACTTIKSIPSTSILSTVMANVNRTSTATKPSPSITTITKSIVKPLSETSVSAPGIRKKEFRIIRTKPVVKINHSSDKLSLSTAYVPLPSANTKQATQANASNETIDNPAVCLSNVANSSLETGPRSNKKAFLLKLKSMFNEHQTKDFAAYVSKISSATTPIVTAISSATTPSVTAISSATTPSVTAISSSPMVSDSCSTDANSCKKPDTKHTNITLSRLPPNSMLLPERKRTHCVLSEKERRAKRRRLEEKYPLPPGVVIKSEPDDFQDDLSSISSSISPAFYGNTSLIPTEYTESSEPFIMSSDDQVWCVENSVNIGSYLTDAGHLTQEHAIDAGMLGLPVNSALEDNESCMNADDSSDEQDEPPALLDETVTDDADEHIQMEDITDAQEDDVPPVLQPMFTSSCLSLVKDTDVQELQNTELIPEISSDLMTFASYNRHTATARDTGSSAASTSTTSLYSEGSIDSGIDTNFPSTSFSYTCVQGTSGPTADRPMSKNLKIQYLKELLKKKEVEIENMKRVQSELPAADFDFDI